MSEMIYAAMGDILKNVGAIAKSHKAPAGAGGYKYRGIEDVMNRLHPFFMEHGIIVSQEFLGNERAVETKEDGKKVYVTMVHMRFTFTHTGDGSSMCTESRGESQTGSDKGTSIAQSVALRVALSTLFLIPTQESIDPEASDDGGNHKFNAASRAIKGADGAEKLELYWKVAQERHDQNEISPEEILKLERIYKERKAEICV